MEKSGVPLLVPTPRRVEMLGGECARPEGLDAAAAALWAWVNGGGVERGAWERGGVRVREEALGNSAEGYELLIDAEPGRREGTVRVRGAGAGLRHAAATLVQLCRVQPARGGGAGGRLARLEIADEPAYSTRGFMLDVSRDKVPTMASLRGLVEELAALKYNHLQLYTEHTFAYAGHEGVWRGCSPMTPGEVRELDGWCRARGIGLAANQNCFGHLARWLRLPEYQHLAETHGRWMFMEFERNGPFSLCPIDDRSLEFVRGLLDQLLPCFSSGLVNIGCDETFDVGFGRSAAEVDKRGRAAVYFEFVNKVAGLVRGHGKRPMLWADIALNEAGSLGSFPRGAIGLAWGYEPDAPFASWCGLLAENGIEAWVCPGTSSWRSITGRTRERRANIAAAAEQGARAGATGFLLTDWGDSGHHQHWPVTLAALAQGAEAAWNPGRARGFDARAASVHVLGDDSGATGVWMDELGDVDAEMRESNRLRNSSALFVDLYRHTTTKRIAAGVEEWEHAAERLAWLGAHLPAGAWRDELAHTVETAMLAAEHGLAVRRGEAAPRDLLEKLKEVEARHIELWGRRNRPGGLDESCRHFERVRRRLMGEEGEA